MADKLHFSFIDFGNRDFVHDEEGNVFILVASSWEEADNFIMEGGLDDFDWTNQGTQKICWDEED